MLLTAATALPSRKRNDTGTMQNDGALWSSLGPSNVITARLTGDHCAYQDIAVVLLLSIPSSFFCMLKDVFFNEEKINNGFKGSASFYIPASIGADSTKKKGRLPVKNMLQLRDVIMFLKFLMSSLPVTLSQWW